MAACITFDTPNLCEKGRKGADALDGICSQAELEKSQANVPNVAIASFTLNKALQHVVPPTLRQNDVARFSPSDLLVQILE